MPGAPFQMMKNQVLALSLCAMYALTGCAADQGPKELDLMERRMGDLERAFGQQAVRVDGLEDRLDLLYDKVETNRLALQRGGMSRSLPLGNLADARPGESLGFESLPVVPVMPTPQALPRAQAPGTQMPELDVVRIDVPRTQQERAQLQAIDQERAAPVIASASPEGQGDEERIVITEKDYQEFTGEQLASETPSRPTGRSAPRRMGGRRSPYAPVTQERLGTTGGADSAPATTAKPTSTPMEMYKQGLSLYRDGQYSDAISNFQGFLKSGPDVDYIDNVYYWLGECNYGLGQYTRSIDLFKKVMRETPQGNKVPDSMLKAALAYFQMGDKSNSKQMIEKLIEIYPNTNAAKVASTRLKSMAF